MIGNLSDDETFHLSKIFQEKEGWSRELVSQAEETVRRDEKEYRTFKDLKEICQRWSTAREGEIAVNKEEKEGGILLWQVEVCKLYFNCL